MSRLRPIAYTVYSTSNSDYQAWRCELLDVSFQRVGQTGQLVRLCSEDPYQPERPFDGSAVAQVLCLPNWADPEPDGARWMIANKPASMALWLESLPASQDDAPVLFLDPDMIFLAPVELDVRPGRVVGQRWVDADATGDPRWDAHASHVRDRITAATIPMYPFATTVGDMRRIVGRFEALSHDIRRANPDCWESDMYGLAIAMHEAGLEVMTQDDLGVCNNWREQREGPARIAHYASPMYDAFWQRSLGQAGVHRRHPAAALAAPGSP